MSFPHRLSLFGIVWAYVVLASLYAINTPPWQVPDEPAHYNYVRTIAEDAALPVLQPGDYDQRYLEALKARKFPPDMPVDALRYEAHQPPAYYVLQAPNYRLGEASGFSVRLLGLRLQSALYGTVLLVLVYRLAAQIFPEDALMPLLAAALAAFVPQHLAIAAGVNNDILAEVVLTAVALQLTRIVGGRGTARAWFWAGILVGVGFLTKTTTYIAVGLVAVAVVLSGWAVQGTQAMWRATFGGAARALLIAVPIGAVWFARGAATYGPSDWLGLARHNAVVVGQPRTLDLYPNYGVAAADWLSITFRSFWGQFGWMGVLLDGRIYAALLAFTVIAVLGLVPAHYMTGNADVRRRRAQLFLLAAWFGASLAVSAAYSLEFFQAQGRYLFPALGAISVLLALGVRGWLSVLGGAIRRLGASAAVVEWALAGTLAAAFAALDLVCLYRYLIPALR